MATDELDILSDTTAESTGLEATVPSSNKFTGSTYEELMEWLPGTALENQLKSKYEAKGWDWENRYAGPWDLYDTDENGRFINEDGEELFYYTGSDYESEHRNRAGLEADATWVTLSDIQKEYEKDQNLQNSFSSFETYEAYLRERSDQSIANGDWTYENKVLGLLEEASGLGRGPQSDLIQGIVQDEQDRQLQENITFRDSLYDKYGIQTTIFNDKGDELAWNGTGYSLVKEYEVDKGKLVTGFAVSLMVSGGLAGPINSALGSVGITGSAATAATSAITSAASQLITTGEIDPMQALISAAIGYGGDKLGAALENSKGLNTTLGKVSEQVDKFKDLVSTGNTVADAAIKAGGVSMLTQLVTTGEIDLTQAAISAALTGVIEFDNLRAGLADAGIPEDEYMADLLENEEFTQAAIDADIKDPFLNPNYTTVGDGLMVNAAGDVFNYAGDSMGNMSTLDINNDGQLSGIDLEEIKVTAEKVSIYDNLDPTLRHYVDSEGRIRTDVRAGDYGKYYTSDGTEVFEARYDNGKLLVADETGAFNVIRNNDGSLYGTYNAETGEWIDSEGKKDPSIDEYMSSKTGVVGPHDIYTGMTKTEYKEMSGPELFDDFFKNKGVDGKLTLTDGEIQELVNRFGSAEAFENFLQTPDKDKVGTGFGVHYSSGTGYIFEAGVDTSDGIYGYMQDDSTIPTLFEPDDLSDPQYYTPTYVSSTSQVDPPWKETETIETVTTTTDTTQTTTSGEDGGGVEVASTAAEDVAGAGTSQEVSTAINNAVNQGASSSALSAAINAALLAGNITPEQAAAAYDSIGTISITTTADGVPVDAGVSTTTATDSGTVTGTTTGGGGLLTGGVTTGGVDTGVSTTTGTDDGTVIGTTAGGVTGGDVTGGTTTEGEVTTGGTATTDTSGTGGSDVVDAGVVGTVVAGTVTGSGDPGAGSPGTDGQDGTGSGGGVGDRDREDRRTAASGSDFERYDWQGLTYTTPTIQEMIQNPNVDYMAPINNVINQGMFGKYI